MSGGASQEGLVTPTKAERVGRSDRHIDTTAHARPSNLGILEGQRLAYSGLHVCVQSSNRCAGPGGVARHVRTVDQLGAGAHQEPGPPRVDPERFARPVQPRGADGPLDALAGG